MQEMIPSAGNPAANPKLARITNLAAQMARRSNAPMLANHLLEGGTCGHFVSDFQEGGIRIAKGRHRKNPDAQVPAFERLIYTRERMDHLEKLWRANGGVSTILRASRSGARVNGYFPLVPQDFVAAVLLENFSNGTIRKNDFPALAQQTMLQMQQNVAACGVEVEKSGGAVEFEMREKNRFMVGRVAAGNLTTREVEALIEGANSKNWRVYDVFCAIEQAAAIAKVKISDYDGHRMSMAVLQLRDRLLESLKRNNMFFAALFGQAKVAICEILWQPALKQG